MQKYKPFTPEQDGRVKLHPSKHAEIRSKKRNGASLTSLAEEYGVSLSLIKIIVYPKRAESVKRRKKEHWKDYHDKESHRLAIRKYRAKKRKLGLTYNPK